MGSVRHLGLAVLLAGWTLVIATGSVLAADPVFGEPTASSSFGKFIEFKQPVTLTAAAARVEILLTTPGAIGPSVVPVPADAPSGASTLDYKVDLADGHIVPNTTFTAQWRVTDDAGKAWLGPPVRHVYADDRFTWKSLDGDVVHVHWVEGDQAFGRKALKIGDDAVAATAKLLGVTETEPIDFFIYADEQAFRAALGPATRENVGGQAHPDIRTLFALIAPADIDAGWIESVVPHELTHVVFATAVDNAYHDPPHWLNEGLAVYLSDGYDDFDRNQVEQAAADGSIIPLDGLAGAFPTTRDRFFLAYAESVSAVDRIVRVNGRDALVKLIRSYADGVSDDAAFQAAIGRDVAGFEADWLGELGGKSPTRVGPRPAPVGPLPAGWEGPQPNPSFEIVGSQPPVTPGAPRPVQPGSPESPIAFLVTPVATIGFVVIFVLFAVGIRRLGRKPQPATPDDSGGNRLFGRSAAIDPDASQAPPSRLWTTTDWSLPREADPVDGAPAAGEAPAPDQGSDPQSETPAEPPAESPSRPDPDPWQRPTPPDDRSSGG